MDTGTTLLTVVFFVCSLACLPWLIKRIQQRHGAFVSNNTCSSKILSVTGIGAQQRVVTIEVGPEHARVWLILGVTSQTISCLHTMNPHAMPNKSASPSFERELANLSSDPNGLKASDV